MSKHNFKYDRLYVQETVKDYENVQNMISELDPEKIIYWHVLNDIPIKYSIRDTKSLIIINMKKYLKKSMAGSKDLICTPFMEFRFGSYCPMACNYCYLNRVFRYKLVPKVVADLYGKGRKQLIKYLNDNKRKTNVIVVGELCDGMIYDRLLSMSTMLAEVASEYPNVVYIVLSKPFLNDIDNYIDIPEKLRRHFIHVISFNPQKIIDNTEQLTPSFDERLKVAIALYNLGYRIRLRIDPIFGDSHLPHVLYPGESKQLYRNMFERIKLSGIDFDKVTLGVFRFFHGLSYVLKNIYPNNEINKLEISRIGKKGIVNNKLETFENVVEIINDLFPDKNISFCREQTYIFRHFKIKPLDCVCKL